MANGTIGEATIHTSRWHRIGTGLLAAIAGVSLAISASLLQKSAEAFLFGTSSTTTHPTPSSAWLIFASSGWGELIGAMALIFLFVVFGYWFVVRRRDFLRSRAYITRQQGAPTLPVLVMALSWLGGLDKRGSPTRRTLAKALRAIRQIDETGPDETAREAARQALLDQLCDPDGPFARWPWQQPLRMLRHHRERLTDIVVVLSVEANTQFTYFARIAGGLMRAGGRVSRAGKAVNIEDYNAVEKTVWGAITLGMRSSRRRADEVCVDITSGNKVYSAAATVVTLNSPGVFGYVETFGPDVGKIVLYDAEIRW